MTLTNTAKEDLLLDITTKPVPTELVLVSPKLAQYWLDTYKYEYQRPLREFQVTKLFNSMRLGSFKLSELKFATTPDGEFFLINGQHRLNAVVKYNKPVLFQVTTVMTGGTKEIGDYYVAEDRGLARGLTDTYAGLNLPDSLGVVNSAIPPLSAALLYIQAGLQGGATNSIRKTITDMRRVELLREWRKEIRELYQISPRGNKGPLSKTFWVNTALAIQLITLRYQNILARQFWTKVLGQEGLLRGTPEFALSHYSQVRPKVASQLDQEHISRAFVLAWNHYFKKNQVFFIQPGRMDFSKPHEIFGTPYNGKQWGVDPKWWDSPDKVREYEGEL